MSGVLHGVIASLKTAVASVTDAYFKYVSLLLNTTSTNGAQNNTFLDSSANAFSVTRNGDTTQGSFNPYMPTGYWSGYFDGTGDYLSSVMTSQSFGTGNFTIEGWVYRSDTNVRGVFQVSGTAGGLQANTTANLALGSDTGQVWRIYCNNSAYNSTATWSTGTWYHFALVRNSGTTTLYIDGTSVISRADTVNYTGTNICVGGYYSTAFLNAGYISNVRVVNGTAVYTSAFTPPTAPVTSISGTSLLCLQDNRFIDNSTNAFAITRNGDTRISKRAPFNPPASYSTATYGGSGYFDGTGDYLYLNNQTELAFGSGDFTIELWVYHNAVGAAEAYYGGNPTSTDGAYVSLGRSSGNVIQYYVNAAVRITSTTSIVSGTWYHIAVSRSGTSTRLFINGTQEGGTWTDTTTYLNGANRPLIGANGYTGGSSVNGYISNLRVVKGTAVYTANFTPPTSPVTAITNTSLLLNFTNAGIYDAAAINDALTVGNAQVSTTQAKFGTTSMYFDGSGDAVRYPTRPEYTLGTGDFTIECWVNVAGASTYRPIVCWRNSSVATTEPDIIIFNTGEVVWYYNGVSRITGTTNVTGAGWVHVAVARSSGSTKLFINGVQEGSTYADTNNYPAANTYLTVGALPPASLYFNGYIDELRITNGYARYTANFTPPTAAFPTL